MNELDNIQTQYLKPNSQTKRERLLIVIEEMSEMLPPVVKMLLVSQRNLVQSLLDQMDDEKIDEVLQKVRETISFIEEG